MALNKHYWPVRLSIALAFVGFFLAKLQILSTSPLQQNTKGQNDITLITAWFPPPEGGPDSIDVKAAYAAGIHRFLSATVTPVVIFTPPSLAEKLRSFRNASLPTRIITSYANVWDIPAVSHLREPFHTSQKALGDASADPHRGRYTPNEYGIWNAKAYLLEQVAELDPFNSTYFFWHDVAALRSSKQPFREWPSPSRVYEVLGAKGHEDTVLLNVIGKQPCYITNTSIIDEPPEVSYTINAAIFGGTKTAVRWFKTNYYDLVDYYLDRGAFVGREERNMHALAMLFPRHFTVVPSWMMEEEALRILWGVHRWYYLNFLAARQDMWSSMRFVPHAPYFADVPFDDRCEPKPGLAQWFERTQRDWKYRIKNICSEGLYRLRKMFRLAGHGDEGNELKRLGEFKEADVERFTVDIWSS